MKYISNLLCVVLASALLAQEPPKPKAALGMNLAGPADFATELPFVDVFRTSRAWISQKKGEKWGGGPKLELDEHGWVKRLGADCFAETPLCTIQGGHYPSGKYTVFYEGEGKLDFAHAAKVVSREAGKLILEVDSSKGGMFLRLLETNPANYLKNIRVIMPGFENTYQEDPFHPMFIKRFAGMSCFRFMDWMHTNNSKIEKWEERPTLANATFSGKGVALEWMIDLCNRQKADAWFCMPHKADDQYVRAFAMMVKEKLDPSLKIYVEYSNEVWNGMFAQSKYAGEQGVSLGIGDAKRPWEAAWHYTGQRSVQIFKIWEEVLGGRQRLVRVLPTQAANTGVTRGVCEFEEVYKQADVLAIAPYISMNVPAQSRDGKGLSAAEVEKWSVDQALDHLENKSLPESIKWIQAQKKLADQYGLKLVCYEAGQHMVGVGGGENNQAMEKLFHQANAHPRMGQIYDKYLAAWQENGGDLMCYFSSIGQWSKWGSWGALQYYDEDAKQSPKFMAIMKWARSLGQKVGVPE